MRYKQMLSRAFRHRSRPVPLSARNRKLTFECCEQRRLLTTYIVDTVIDNNSATPDGLVSLREALTAANNDATYGDAPAGNLFDADVILFSESAFVNNPTIRLQAGDIAIDGPVIIDTNGKNITIDAQGSDRIFTIDASAPVFISGLRLINGSSDAGGAIYVRECENLVLSKMTFENNAANVFGSVGGGAIFVEGYSEIDDNETDLTVKDSFFRSNIASGANAGGGAINALQGRVQIITSRFDQNEADLAGGGVFVSSGDLQVYASQFINNRAVGAGGAGGGLAVVESDGSVVDSLFAGNFASEFGGGIASGESDLTISGSTIQDNQSFGQQVDQGGGGIVHYDGNLILLNSQVLRNRALGSEGSGGGLLISEALLFAEGSNISENRASRAGGGIASDASYLEIVRSNIVGNIAGPEGQANPGLGGGIYSAGTDGNIVQSSVFYNSAAQSGGGLWQDGNSDIVVSASVFGFNNARGTIVGEGGGAIFNDGGDLNIRFSQIHDNFAIGTNASGGGLFTAGGTVEIVGTALRSNASTRSGGGIQQTAGQLNVYLSSIENNTAGRSGQSTPGDGGGVHIDGSNAQTFFFRGFVVGNVAANEGGGIWSGGGANTAFHAVQVFLNSADLGGGIYASGGTLELVLANVALNNARSQDGGGIYVRTTASVNAFASTVDSNSAGSRGGGIFNGGTLGYRNGVVTKNSATTVGGGLFADAASNATLVNSVFAENVPQNIAGPGSVALS